MIGVAGIAVDDEQTRLGRDLRDARDLVVQLQRELERARGVIAEQQAIVHAAYRAARGGER